MTLVGPTMRLRCPSDAPEAAAQHLAIDVRLPCSLTVLDALSRRLPRCGCGAKLVIALDAESPAASAEGGAR